MTTTPPTDAPAPIAPVGNTFTKDAVWTLIGNVAYTASLWGILIVLARLGDEATVGKYALALAFVSPTVLLTGLQLHTVLATDALNEHRFGEYLSMRLVTAGGAAVIALTVTSCFETYRPLLLLVLFLLLAKLSESTSDIVYGLYQKQRRLDLAGLSRIARGGAGVIVLALTFALTRSVEWAVLAMGLTWMAGLLFIDLPVARQFTSVRPAWDGRRTWRLLWLGLPLGMTLGLVNLTSQVPRFTISRLGAADAFALVGIYSTIAYFNQGVALIGQAACQSASARLATHYIHDLKRYLLLVGFLAACMALTAVLYIVGVFTLGRPMLLAIYGPEYAARVDVFHVIAFSGAADLFASVCGFSITAARWFAIQPAMRIATLTVCIVSVSLLADRYGLIGAAWGMVITSSFTLLVSAIVLAAAVNAARRRGSAIAPP